MRVVHSRERERRLGRDEWLRMPRKVADVRLLYPGAAVMSVYVRCRGESAVCRVHVYATREERPYVAVYWDCHRAEYGASCEHEVWRAREQCCVRVVHRDVKLRVLERIFLRIGQEEAYSCDVGHGVCSDHHVVAVCAVDEVAGVRDELCGRGGVQVEYGGYHCYYKYCPAIGSHVLHGGLGFSPCPTPASRFYPQEIT